MKGTDCFQHSLLFIPMVSKEPSDVDKKLKDLVTQAMFSSLSLYPLTISSHCFNQYLFFPPFSSLEESLNEKLVSAASHCIKVNNTDEIQVPFKYLS